MLNIIAAMDEKRGIGKNNSLMWNIPEDLARFKTITMGHPIIMGRKTFESIGRVLPGRTNIIITRDKEYKVVGAVVAESLEEAIKKAEESIKYKVSGIDIKNNTQDTIYHIPDTNEHEVFIIGGGQIFEQSMPLVDRLYLTIVKGDFGADTFFPEYSKFKKVISEESHEDKEAEEYKYSFITLEK